MNIAVSRKGRPPKDQDAVTFHGQPLHSLFVTKLPAEFVKNEQDLDTTALSKAINVSRFSIYRWLNGEAISQRSARSIIAVSKGNITKDDLIPFMLRF